MQRIGLQGGQGRGRTLLGIDLLPVGRVDLHRTGDGTDLGTAADAGGQQHATHQQARAHQRRQTEQMGSLLQGAARVDVAQHRRFTLQRRAKLNGIAIAQLDGANAPVTMKQTIGGIEILQGEVAIGIAWLLEDGVHPAQPQCLHGQLTGGITADAVAPVFEG